MYVFAVHLHCAFFSILKCHGRNGVGHQNLAKDPFTCSILRCIFALCFLNQFNLPWTSFYCVFKGQRQTNKLQKRNAKLWSEIGRVNETLTRLMTAATSAAAAIRTAALTRGRNLGRVFNFRSGCMYDMHLSCNIPKRPNLVLKTWPWTMFS